MEGQSWCVCDVRLIPPRTAPEYFTSYFFNYHAKFLGQHLYSDGLRFHGLTSIKKLKHVYRNLNSQGVANKLALKAFVFKQFKEKRQRLVASDCTAQPWKILKNSYRVHLNAYSSKKKCHRLGDRKRRNWDITRTGKWLECYHPTNG